MGKSLDLSEAILRAREVHGERFDYSEASIYRAKSEVFFRYRCPRHGDVVQRLTHHLDGRQCQTCSSGGVIKFKIEAPETKPVVDVAGTIGLAKAIHGDRFDYSQAEIFRSKGEWRIKYRCPLHGSIEQRLGHHMNGRQCQRCANTSLSFAEYVTQATEACGGAVTYSSEGWTNLTGLVWIFCPSHGRKRVGARHHLVESKGCPTCIRSVPKLTTAKFITKAKAIHGDVYDYSSTKFVDFDTAITFGCRVHGLIKMSPASHLHRKRGCGSCSAVKRKGWGETKGRLQKDFVARARETHGDRYSYPDIIPPGSEAKVEITCSVHGIFLQRKSVHIFGSGCPKCSKHYRMTMDEFIASARDVHGTKYGYEKVAWRGSSKSIVIVCPEHGDFTLRGRTHLEGGGCRICAGRKMTKETFVARAREIHGDRYTYDLSGFTNSQGSVLVTCSKHGVFKKRVQDYLEGSGCNVCRPPRYRMSAESFFEEAARVHSGRYDYAQSVYRGLDERVTYRCPEHGEVSQHATKHVSGLGCRLCRMAEVWRKLTFEGFVERARARHGNRFTYPEGQDFTGRKVQVICPEHGSFETDKQRHLKRSGCPACAIKFRTMGKEEFISRARAKHGDRYDYSEVEIINSRSNVTIICPEHGRQTQNARNHILGTGCRPCGEVVRVEKQKMSFERFVVKARAKFGDRFEYSEEGYVDYHTPFQVRCERHGLSLQKPKGHWLSKHGCRYCSGTGSEAEFRWLEWLGVPWDQRHVLMKIAGKQRWVDAYDPLTMTVYEFWGDLWHGHPNLSPGSDPRRMGALPAEVLYAKTMQKRAEIIGDGYRLVEVWERDFLKLEAGGLPEQANVVDFVVRLEKANSKGPKSLVA